MRLGKVILQLERARKKLISANMKDRNKLLEMSREVDKFIVEYYRRNLASGPKIQ
ncbi:MAG: Spo0E family sporulation regulatory protein-aspartic acid phosphatase [Thermacetogeniaceae bacterium]